MVQGINSENKFLNQSFLISLTALGTVMESSTVKELREKIHEEESNLQKLMSDTDSIWEDMVLGGLTHISC